MTYAFTVTNVGDLSTETDPGSDDVEIRIDLDTTFEDSTFVSSTATADFSCSQPFLLDIIPSTDVLCINTTTGLDPAEGTLITITVDVDTASTPSFVDFDVIGGSREHHRRIPGAVRGEQHGRPADRRRRPVGRRPMNDERVR